MDKAEVEARILGRLYEAFFKDGGSCNLHLIRDEVGLEENAFGKIADYLTREGFIKAWALGGSYRITPLGIVHAEERNLIPEALKSENERIRTTALDALASLYEESPHRDIHIEILSATAGIAAQVLIQNLMVLRDFGYVEAATIGGFEITNRGLAAVEDLRQRRGLVDEFNGIKALSPQPRGRALQKLFAKIVGRQEWSQEEGVRTSHEEMDVIVHKNREYYLVECKWEKDPVEADVVRELFGKLSNRVGVQGIVVSMSGFSGGAIEQIKKFSGSRLVLCFGSNDVESLLYGKLTFDALLNDKYQELVMRAKVVFK